MLAFCLLAALHQENQVTTDDDEDEKQNTFHFTKADDACASTRKCLENVIFYFRWNWQVQLLDLRLVRVVLGHFQNFNSNEPFTYKRCMNYSSVDFNDS